MRYHPRYEPTIETEPRGARELTPATALEQLVAAGRATVAVGDVLAVMPPIGGRPKRRASRALDELRRNER